MLPLLYNLIFPFAFLVLLPGYLARMVRRGHYRRDFWQRLGFYSETAQRRLVTTRGAVWLQAVSVGEMLVALKLLTAMRAREPGLAIVVSTTTTTGFALAEGRVPPDVPVVYTPIDTRGSVERAFRAIAPAQLVIVDGGLWPNQLWTAHRRGVPTALVNARLSPRSERRFRRFLAVAQALFLELDLIGVPEAGDRQRWTSLGVPGGRIQHTGSIKFDEPAPDGEADSAPMPRNFLRELGIADEAPVLLAASTHPGEERIVGEVFRRLRRLHPTLFLIVVPRHVERTSEVKSTLELLGHRVALRTSPPGSSLQRPDVLLLNTTGELRAWYPVATLAFVGKSLRAIGGQNPAEAALAGVPVLFGPHMENFDEITRCLLSAKAAVQVTDQDDLERKCVELLAQPETRARLAAAAREQLAAHRGASTRTAELLQRQRQDFPCKSA